jgi:glucose/arabinose dehydrogenase
VLASRVLLCALLAAACVSCSTPADRDRDEGPSAASPTRPGSTAPSPRGPRLARLRLRLEPAASGFEAPLLATHSGDGSERMFVVEQTGAIKISEGGRVLPTPFLDLEDRVIAGGEQGLLGLAFHPDYPRNGRLFVNYTDLEGNTVVAEFLRSPGGLTADPASERVLMRIPDPFVNHNGGALEFGPDGHLYVATGDGGSAGDPLGNGQSLDTLLGKLLRIDVDVEAPEPYGIPPDNPFVGRSGARPEIWAYGLRNPWRFSFDRPSDTLWIADVGQNDWEEVNRAPLSAPGLNYGWNVMEGSACFDPPQACDRSGLELPLATYSHSEGCSVTGGHVYRGPRPALRGIYFFADFCSGRIWGLDAAGGSPQEPQLLLNTGRPLSSFGTDGSGELYVTDHGSGELLRLVGEAGGER